jgi:hypothetical protein
VGETVRAIAEFLQLNKRNALALFGAGVSLWFLLRLEIVKNDTAQIAIAYLACFGLFIFVSRVVETRVRAAKLVKRHREVALERTRAAQAAAVELERQAATDRAAALDNLQHLDGAESAALLWIHNKGMERVRANQREREIAAIVRLKILLVEDQDMPFTDRIFVVPNYVRNFLAERIGKPQPKKASDKPPWEGDRL